MNLKDLKGIYE